MKIYTYLSETVLGETAVKSESWEVVIAKDLNNSIKRYYEPAGYTTADG
jgi:hypothetical protein